MSYFDTQNLQYIASKVLWLSDRVNPGTDRESTESTTTDALLQNSHKLSIIFLAIQKMLIVQDAELFFLQMGQIFCLTLNNELFCQSYSMLFLQRVTYHCVTVVWGFESSVRLVPMELPTFQKVQLPCYDSVFQIFGVLVAAPLVSWAGHYHLLSHLTAK